MKRVFGYNTKLLKRNFRAVVIFEIIFKITAATLLSSLIMLLLKLSIKWSGLRYVTERNISQYLLSPATIAIIFAIILILILYTLLEITCIIISYDASRKNEKITVIDVFTSGIKKIVSLFKPSGIPIILLTGVLIPLSGLPIFSGALTDLNIPSLTMGTVIREKYFYISLFLMILLAVFSLFYILVLHQIIIYNQNLVVSFKTTIKLLKRRKLKAIGIVCIWYVVIAISLIALYAVIIGIVSLIVKLFNTPDYGLVVFLSVLRALNIVIVFAFSCLAEPLIISILSALFFRLKQVNNEIIDSSSYYTFNIKNRRMINHRILPIVFVVTFIINMAYLSSIIKNSLFDDIEMLRVVDITAHRGSSFFAPENTLKGIEMSITQMADFAEIDVHETSDGTVVLLHDDNLKRTTDFNSKIWDITYEDVSKLDAGSWFSGEFAGEKVPTLDEVIKYAKGKINLNIEIKASSYEPDLVSSVVKIIEDNNFEDNCVVTSFSYSVIKKVKQLNPSVKTGLISSMILGNYSISSSADCMSINYLYITKESVEEMHKNGIKVIAWTVNNKDTMKRMLDYGVDNIISDNPVVAREVVYSNRQTPLIRSFIKIVFSNYT